MWYFKFENLQNLKDRIHKNHIISEKTLSILTKDLNNKNKKRKLLSL